MSDVVDHLLPEGCSSCDQVSCGEEKDGEYHLETRCAYARRKLTAVASGKDGVMGLRHLIGDVGS
jgi:hypothetical protein